MQNCSSVSAHSPSITLRRLSEQGNFPLNFLVPPHPFLSLIALMGKLFKGEKSEGRGRKERSLLTFNPTKAIGRRKKERGESLNDRGIYGCSFYGGNEEGEKNLPPRRCTMLTKFGVQGRFFVAGWLGLSAGIFCSALQCSSYFNTGHGSPGCFTLKDLSFF